MGELPAHSSGKVGDVARGHLDARDWAAGLVETDRDRVDEVDVLPGGGRAELVCPGPRVEEEGAGQDLRRRGAVGRAPEQTREGVRRARPVLRQDAEDDVAGGGRVPVL